MNATATANTRLAELIAQALPEGYTAEIIGTGGNCRAIEVKWDATDACVLITNGDCALPYDEDGAFSYELAVGGYDAEGEPTWDDETCLDMVRNIQLAGETVRPEILGEAIADTIRENLAL